jgi:hypothetical protein
MLQHTVKHNDTGAVSVIFAVVSAFVLLPLLMLVVDTGGLYLERRQLQHGADAAVMAVARSCGTTCEPASAAVYAGPNTLRGADVIEVCGTLLGTSCTPSSVDPSASPYDCEPLPAGGDYVQVQVRSATGGWQPWFFGNKLNVPACARAALGPLGSLSGGLPITMSICEWETATASGYAPPPPYDAWPPPVSPDPALFERTVELQSGGASSDPADPGCHRGPASAFVPGGFGWLESTDCTAVVEDGSVEGGEGSSNELQCKDDLANHWLNREPVFLPVHDVASGTGGGDYEVAGYAAFVITGYDLASAGRKRSWLTNTFPACPGPGGSGKCITGFFTQALAPSGGSVTLGPGFGASTPYLVS